MEVDNDNTDVLACFKPLFSAVQAVFQNVNSLSLSFRFKNPSSDMSLSMPSIPPFNIDFNSVRRSYTLMFGLSANSSHQVLVDELEKHLDLAVYTLCFKVRMTLKQGASLSEDEVHQILHALLVVNELPILEDPKYMDRCAKIFYATINELPVSGAASLARLWSKWKNDELKVYLNKVL